jgi:glutamine amidotransferase
MIVIVDYGMGNLQSIKHKFDRMDIPSVISSDPADNLTADKLILPGGGPFAAAMQNLYELGLVPILEKKVLEEKTPILGICLGMQLFSKRSEEGDADGLGWVDAETVRFDLRGIDPGLKVPHMGWNTIHMVRQERILDNVEDNSRFYFVHSYHVKCNDPCDVLAMTSYGLDFTSMLRKDHIYGIQFHPEKSHNRGIRILKNFASVV